MLSQEAGPFDVFLRLRTLAGVRHDEQGFPVGDSGFVLGKLLSCLWCTSIWTAGACLLLWQFVHWPIWLLDASTIAILINWLERR